MNAEGHDMDSQANYESLFDTAASSALRLMQEGEFFIAGVTEDGAELATHVLQVEGKVHRRHARKRIRGEWKDASTLDTVQSLERIGVVPATIATMVTKRLLRRIDSLEVEVSRLEARLNGRESAGLSERASSAGSTGTAILATAINVTTSTMLGRGVLGEGTSTSGTHSIISVSSDHSYRVSSMVSVEHSHPSRFDLNQTAPIMIDGFPAPAPTKVCSPTKKDTSKTAESLLVQYYAVRKYKEAIGQWKPTQPLDLPKVIDSSQDKDLTDNELLTLAGHYATLLQTNSNIERRPDLYTERNILWCRIAAAASTWMSRKTSRSIRKFVMDVKKNIGNNKSFRRLMVKAAINFREIAASTPGDLWQWFPLTESVLECGPQDQWKTAIAEYAIDAQRNALL